MEKLNKEIDDLYESVLISDPQTQENINFTEIRDQFRQHVNNRRFIQDDSKVLLSQSQILKLVSLKKSIEEIQTKFSELNSKEAKENLCSIVDFISHISSQQEVLSSELWKLESFTDYVERISQSQDQNNVCQSVEL